MTNQTRRPALLAAIVTMIGAAAGAALVTVARAEATLPPTKPAQMADAMNLCGKEFAWRPGTKTSYGCSNAFEVRCREGYSATNPTLRHTIGNNWAVSYRCESNAVPR